MKGDAEDRTLTEMERRAVKLWDGPSAQFGAFKYLWYRDDSTYYKLLRADGSVVNSASIPAAWDSGDGMGGDDYTVYASADFADKKVGKLSPDDFSIIETHTYAVSVDGIGGTAGIAYFADLSSFTFHRINPNDWSTIAESASDTYRPEGIGGDSKWAFALRQRSTPNGAWIWKYDPADMSLIEQGAQTIGYPSASVEHEGAGGNKRFIYSLGNDAYSSNVEIERVNINDLYTIDETITPPGSPNSAWGIGGGN